MTDLVSLILITMIPIEVKITKFSLHLYICTEGVYLMGLTTKCTITFNH